MMFETFLAYIGIVTFSIIALIIITYIFMLLTEILKSIFWKLVEKKKQKMKIDTNYYEYEFVFQDFTIKGIARFPEDTKKTKNTSKKQITFDLMNLFTETIKNETPIIKKLKCRSSYSKKDS